MTHEQRVAWVQQYVTGPLCAAYLAGLDRGHLTAGQMGWLANKDLARAYEMGLHERRTGRPEAM